MRQRLLLLGTVAVTLSACGGNAPLIGQRTPPDETKVVDGPPLTLPPNFDLRPPRDGSSSAEELLRNRPVQAADQSDAWLFEKIDRIDNNIREDLTPPAQPEPVLEEKLDDEPEEEKKSLFFGWGSKESDTITDE